VVLLETEPGQAIPLHEVKALAATFDVTRPLMHFHVFPGVFPVDARHNAKIEREKLSVWATEQGLGQ